MTREEEMKNKDNNNKEYEKDLNHLKERILKDGDTLVSKRDLLERFCEVDEAYNSDPWNLLQILTNINILIGQESCEDAVSRQAVLALAKEECDTAIIPYRRFVKDINALSPVTPTQRWTPCSERLPKERGMYIVTEKVFSVTDKEHAGGFNLMTEQVEFDNGKWRRASFYEVIAWMPLLKPYQEERECCSDCKHHTDAEEIHGATPCGSCGVDKKNFE